jgi:hypothetical protein
LITSLSLINTHACRDDETGLLARNQAMKNSISMIFGFVIFYTLGPDEANAFSFLGDNMGVE